MKRFLLCAASAMCITISICLIVITVSYYESLHKPKATINLEGLVKYEQFVDSTAEAADLFWQVRDGINNRK